jgi:hypothetical protein
MRNVISTFISRRIKWEGQISCMGENRNTYRVGMVTPEGLTLF